MTWCKFESEKDLCDHFPKIHENRILSNMKCAYGKCTRVEVCDDCLDDLWPNENENNE